MFDVYVFRAPRHRVRVFQSGNSVAGAIAFVRAQPDVDWSSLVVRLSDPRSDGAAVCVPLRMFEDAVAAAAALVGGWDEHWLLIESTARRHRESARDQLIEAIAAALVSAAATGTHGADDIVF